MMSNTVKNFNILTINLNVLIIILIVQQNYFQISVKKIVKIDF